jgi:hypothetical protein
MELPYTRIYFTLPLVPFPHLGRGEYVSRTTSEFSNKFHLLRLLRRFAPSNDSELGISNIKYPELSTQNSELRTAVQGCQG